MSIHLNENDIQKIIQSVLQNVEAVLGKPHSKPIEETPVMKAAAQFAVKKATSIPNSNSKADVKHDSPALKAALQFAVKNRIPDSAIAAKPTHAGITPKKLSVTSHYAVQKPTNDTDGVFEQMEDAIAAGYLAQQKYVKQFQLQDRERIITAIRNAVISEKESLAKMVFEETKIGNYEDKIAKHHLAAVKTPGIEDLTTAAFSGDNGLTIVEQAPFGLIGAVTPVTNPTETIINNTISMIAGGNAVVFNVHPASKHSCAYVVTLLNQTIKEAGGPSNLVTMVKTPSMETLDKLMTSPKVKLLVGTGGPGLVSTLLKSGKKVIGAGGGNPPVIVDETADLENAAKSIILGASFDNNLLCIAEKEVFVIDEIADDLIYHLLNHGAYMLDRHQVEKVMSFALEKNIKHEAKGCSLNRSREYYVAKDWVGKSANEFMKKLGHELKPNVKLLICDVEATHPFVQIEQMMPVLPIVRVKDLDEAIELAVEAEHGHRHTAIMHSKNVDRLTKFARVIDTTIFVKNASSLAGVGYGGEGHATMTIAGPTGEGITSAKTFTRQRRSVLAQGSFGSQG